MNEARWRAWLYAFLTILAAAAVVYLFWVVLVALAPVVTVAALGLLLAVLLNPLANYIQRGIHSRPLSALAVVLLILAPVVVILTWLVTTVVRESQTLLAHLPVRLERATNLLNTWQNGLERIGVHVNLAGELSSMGGEVLRHSISILSGAATVTTDLVLALIVAFFVIWDGSAMRRSARALLSDRWRRPTLELAEIIATSVADFIRAQFLVALIFGLMIGLSMALLHLPDPVLLGFLAGLFELLPTIGPILGAVGPVGLSLAQPFPHVIWVLLVFIAAQQLESNILVPRISGRSVGLHPLTVILSVFAGFHLAGLIGAFIAVPVAAAIREVLRRWWQPAASVLPNRAQARPAPQAPPPPSAPREGVATVTPALPPAPPAPVPTTKRPVRRSR